MIALLFALAVACFVISLPIAKTALGGRLRQAAGVCFVLGLLPSLIVGLFFPPSGAPTGSDGRPAHDLLARLGCIAAVILASLLAYGILKLRSFFAAKSKPRDPWESFFNRGGGKRPFTIHTNSRRDREPFTFTVEEDDDE